MESLLNFYPYNEDRMSVDDIHAMGSVVYFIFAGEELLYVGQSKNFRQRVRGHRARFDEEAELTNDSRLRELSFVAFPVPPERLDEVEYYYIRKFLPPYNKDYMPEEIYEAYSAVRLAKMELVMAQIELDCTMYEYRRKVEAEHKTEERSNVAVFC